MRVMYLPSVALLVAVLVGVVQARGAGRAFPIDAENYVMDAFEKINRNIEWDKTNFLVDLSGEYAQCENIGRGGAFLPVEELTPEGGSIAAYVDETDGSGNNVDEIISYVRAVIDKWTLTGGQQTSIIGQIASADSFGCSVKPGCKSGRVSVACLFTPSNTYQPPPPPEPEATTRKVYEVKGGRTALAFTEEQYAVAEGVTGEKWDTDHFLENLSGSETICGMISNPNLSADFAVTTAEKFGRDVQLLYGSAVNRGETEPAMVEVLRVMDVVYGAKAVGCSILPDCMLGGTMYVVVGCLFQV